MAETLSEFSMNAVMVEKNNPLQKFWKKSVIYSQKLSPCLAIIPIEIFIMHTLIIDMYSFKYQNDLNVFKVTGNNNDYHALKKNDFFIQIRVIENKIIIKRLSRISMC